MPVNKLCAACALAFTAHTSNSRESLSAGFHEFEFVDSAGRVIPVHYYIASGFAKNTDDTHNTATTTTPPNNTTNNATDDDDADFERAFEQDARRVIADSSVLFVCHGVLRNAQAYLSNWVKLAEQYKLLVVCPEFSADVFPDTDYNFGAIVGEGGAQHNAFRSMDAIFETFSRAGLRKTGYSLFGHSAGAQFAHRMALFAPDDSRCVKIVAANAGWYTLPTLDTTQPWPYSLAAAPLDVSDHKHMASVFARKLQVILGQEDTASKFLRTTHLANRQGHTRFDRGVHFFTTARDEAARLGVRFNWSLQTVPNSGHSNRRMALFAARFLFGK